MGDLKFLYDFTHLPVPVDRVLDAAKNDHLEKVIIIGENEEESYYFSSSHSDKAWLVLKLSHVLHKLLNGDYE